MRKAKEAPTPLRKNPGSAELAGESACPTLAFKGLQLIFSQSRKQAVLLAAALFLAAGAFAADEKEVAVGLVLNGVGGKVLRADTETPLAARPGDLLFAGDGLRT
jgi:hypothetical protein